MPIVVALVTITLGRLHIPAHYGMLATVRSERATE
jgi:hypothetical protein